MFRPDSLSGPILLASRETTHIPSRNRPRSQSFVDWLAPGRNGLRVSFQRLEQLQFSGRNVRGFRESDSHRTRWKRSRNWKLPSRFAARHDAASGFFFAPRMRQYSPPSVRYATGSGSGPLLRTPSAYMTQHGNAIISVLTGSAGVQKLITATWTGIPSSQGR